MGNNKLYSLKIHKEVDNKVLVTAVFNTYAKIINGYTIEMMSEEDINVIKNFYCYLTINSAKDMLSTYHKSEAYEEMQNYVGNYVYPIEMKKAFLNKYLEYLDYTKTSEQNVDTYLKFA